MNDSEVPYISVLITAYDRKEFLLNAIKSVVNQTLEKKYYEIIVVKNFNDDLVDDFIEHNNISNIYSCDTTLSGKLVEALNIARGTVISFLEDDDQFISNKLQIVYNKFKSKNVVYYDNDQVTINEKYNRFYNKSNKGIAFNMSSISVKKSILNLNYLKKVNLNYALDYFMYLSALESGQNIIRGKDKLTYYMVHNSASNVYTDDINEFIKRKTSLAELDISTFLMFHRMFISTKAKNFITQKIANDEIDRYIYGNNKKPENALNIFKKGERTFSVRLEIYILYLIVRIHYNFRYNIIKKLFIENKKRFY